MTKLAALIIAAGIIVAAALPAQAHSALVAVAHDSGGNVYLAFDDDWNTAMRKALDNCQSSSQYGYCAFLGRLIVETP